MKEEMLATTKSFRELLEKELRKRSGGGGNGRKGDDDKGKPDRPDGPNLILALILGALAGLFLVIAAKSKPKTKNS